jgi:hypothetical protein
MADPSPQTSASARYLQSRIQTLSLSLLQHFQSLVSTASSPNSSDNDNAGSSPQPTDNDGAGERGGPTVAGEEALKAEDTAARRLEMQIETTALIRTAEEVLVLTRGLKELWLFDHAVDASGGDVGAGGQETNGNEGMLAWQKEAEDVTRGMAQWIAEDARRRVEIGPGEG